MNVLFVVHPLAHLSCYKYNYIYGVTGVPFLSFMGGIFLGSLKVC